MIIEQIGNSCAEAPGGPPPPRTCSTGGDRLHEVTDGDLFNTPGLVRGLDEGERVVGNERPLGPQPSDVPKEPD